MLFRSTTRLIVQIKALMLTVKNRLRDELPKIYSQDLVNNLFRHPYTKIDFLAEELQVTRKTAAKYLEELVGIGMLSKFKLGKDNFYLNAALYQLLGDVGKRKLGEI